MDIVDRRSLMTGQVPYTLIFNNQSLLPYTFLCFQSPSGWLPAGIFPLAWVAIPVPPTKQMYYTWTVDYSFQWASTGTLAPGGVFSSAQNVPAGLMTENQVTFTHLSNGTYELTHVTTASGPALHIVQDATIPFNAVSVGIAMAGSAIYAVQAQPNIETTFNHPVPGYFVSYAPLMQQGEVLNVPTLPAIAEITFPPNAYTATATLLPNLSWSISYGPAMARPLEARPRRLTLPGSRAVTDVDRKYTGYRDEKATGYSGVQASIDYIKPQSVCHACNTWVGLDNVTAGVDGIWVQIGWAYEVQPATRIASYAEVNRADGSYNIYYFNPLVGGVTYAVAQDTDAAVWSIAGSEVHRESWSGIVGSDVMPNAQYTVEVFDPSCDYVPGSSSNKNFYRDIKLRVAGGAYQDAPLATDQTDDPNGRVEKNTAGSSWMAVWDNRATALQAGSAAAVTLATTDPNSPIAWRPAATPTSAHVLATDALEATARARLADASAAMTSLQWVQFQDAHAFAGPHATLAGQLSLASVEVTREAADRPATARVGLHLFMAPDTGALLAAATRPQERWIARHAAFAPADPQREAARVGMTVAFEATAVPRLSVEAVLAAVWRDMGVPPDAAGQIILRPRIVTPSFPKVRRDGVLVPERPRGLYWIVEVLGTHVHNVISPRGERRGYLTGLLGFVDDANGEAFYTIGLP